MTSIQDGCCAIKANKYVSLESKVYIKYLGVLINQNLSWKYHIDFIFTKISKTVGLIAKLRHSVPRPILLSIYNSLIHPYLTYGLATWGQACKTYLNKILILQKRAMARNPGHRNGARVGLLSNMAAKHSKEMYGRNKTK